MSLIHVDLAYGQSAFALLEDEQFLVQWRTLYAASHYATAFQTPHFVSTWYGTYCPQWQPVVVFSRDEVGALVGVWLLAHDKLTNTIAHAGTHQAEYHAWLALPGREGVFLAAAWDELLRRIEFSTLRFKYLPPGASDILCAALGGRCGIVVRRHTRPLLTLDAVEIKASFAKKSNKSRFNRLKKLGRFEFRRVSDADELERSLDELTAFYDFRQGAINSTTPFREDPLKRKFHLDLFIAASTEDYVTISYLDERPIAAFWGAVSGEMVHLGMLIYSPFLALHSPGKLHIMQLSDQLLKDGKHVLDLTPGGDPWKERFANAHDEVTEVILYQSRRARFRAVAASAVLQNVKRSAAYLGITPAKVRSAFDMLRISKLPNAGRKLASLTGGAREFRVYRCDRELASLGRLDGRVACNSLPDLLAFEPGESWQTRDMFLSSALTRIEQGESVFTIKVGERLAHVGWMASNQLTSYMTEVKQSMTFPSDSVALYDFYSHPDFRGRGLYRAAILHMLNVAFANLATHYVYISVLANNSASRHVIEAVGFEYQRSFFWERRFGKERKWQVPEVEQAELANA